MPQPKPHMNQRKTAAQLAEEFSNTATPAEIATLDQEIYELGLAEPALCCCEYSTPAATTGGKHISHHFCDCQRLEDALVRLCSTCCTDSSAWHIIFNQIQSKSLVPFPGGAVKVPIELWCGALVYLLFRMSRWYVYLEERPWHAAFATALLVALMGWANLLMSRRKIRTDVFMTWFLISVLHDAWTVWKDLFSSGEIYPLEGIVLLLLGLLMLVILATVRRQAGRAHTRYMRSNDSKRMADAQQVRTVTLRSKHCSMCNHRLDTFDHHCTFINCCVSEENHVMFALFCLSATSSIGGLVQLLWTNQAFWSGTIVYNIIVFPFVAGLTIFQFFLIAINLTTNEWMLRDRYEHLKDGQRPFNQGIAVNISLFVSNDRSSIQRRRVVGVGVGSIKGSAV